MIVTVKVLSVSSGMSAVSSNSRYDRWRKDCKGRYEAQSKPKLNSTSTMHFQAKDWCRWAISRKNLKGGGTLPNRISMQELKVYQPRNLTSSGEKVALTQVVEHHLPTYASLALVRQKWEWNTCKKNRKWNESTAWWKCNTNTRHL